MKKSAASERYEPFFAAASIAAHASTQGNGFRQKDILFLIELFTNWVEASARSLQLSLQATQISRYLDDLITEGYARKRSKKRHPLYTLTRTGLLELVDRIVAREYTGSQGHFFFFYYFIKNYQHLITHLIEQEGRLFPEALKLELEGLLDAKAFLKRELSASQKEYERLQLRIHDSDATAALTKKRLKEKVPFEEIIIEIQQHYPYELNSQKPLEELLADLPVELQRWEMETGTYFRSNEMWRPAYAQIECYIEELKKLQP
jgi:hypothetical protein